ncbi:MAG: putative exported protein [Pseudomonadota bacterium]
MGKYPMRVYQQAGRALQHPASSPMVRMLVALLGAGLLWLCMQVVHAQPTAVVGDVTIVVGKAKLRQGNGQWQALKTGDRIHEDARLETEADGYVYVKTVDSGFISLRPNSALSVESYHYDPQRPNDTRIKLTLHKGVMRSISGVGAQNAKDKFRLNTPVAAIGIRGTDFSTFTDSATTLLSVRSGGVVASPFGGSCDPSGMGPCEGKFSADLLASRAESVLQVKLGDARARLIDNPTQQLQPDKIAPPLPSEKTSANKTNQSVPSSTLTSEIELAQAVEKLDAITWGRWQYLVNMSPASSVEEVQRRMGGQFPLIAGLYAMGRTSEGDLTLPRDGKFGFALKGYEAFILNYNTGRAENAGIRNGALSVDFDRRSFETSIDVHGDSGAVAVRGRGSITNDGQMVGDLLRSNASIDGVLAGKDARQAGYVFSKPVDERGLSAYGATYWGR